MNEVRSRGMALPCPYNYLYLTNLQSAVKCQKSIINNSLTI
ncbi:hypothetical protein GXM_00148 [Nostoc sphaeroides CCNUC1]|uniref:Uncharacterized protein n=1 Tax=Nostoc sphaeroides CCNUC1 TaxID=2653204 RepID=A0A5P8VQH3_9NOSO|nr:hypothetical protein GXM_00148 [Nostoc sphaeroides CCNUC1]